MVNFLQVYIVFFYNINKRFSCCTTTTSYHSRRIAYFLSFHITIHFTWFGLFCYNKINPVMLKVKTDKINNWATVIASGCCAAVGSLLMFVKKRTI